MIPNARSGAFGPVIRASMFSIFTIGDYDGSSLLGQFTTVSYLSRERNKSWFMSINGVNMGRAAGEDEIGVVLLI